jgi:Vitamin K-dependent gamma-carboxylase
MLPANQRSGLLSRLADQPPQHLIGTRALELSIAAYLIFTTLTEWPFASYLWGWHGVAHSHLQAQLGPLGTPALWLFQQPLGAQVLLGAQLLAALGLLLRRLTLVAKLTALLSFATLSARNPYLPDGGNNIMQLTLYYLLFLSSAATLPGGTLRAWLHQLAVWIIRAQVIILYLTAGLSKLRGIDWQNGTALYVISRVEWFSHPLFANLFKYPLITYGATYTTMIYQILFPAALFIRRLRLPFILFGIALHLGIAVMMGLIAFSTIMIGLELFLIQDDEYRMLAAWGQARWQRLTRRQKDGVAGTPSRPARD